MTTMMLDDDANDVTAPFYMLNWLLGQISSKTKSVYVYEAPSDL